MSTTRTKRGDRPIRIGSPPGLVRDSPPSWPPLAIGALGRPARSPATGRSPRRPRSPRTAPLFPALVPTGRAADAGRERRRFPPRYPAKRRAQPDGRRRSSAARRVDCRSARPMRPRCAPRFANNGTDATLKQSSALHRLARRPARRPGSGGCARYAEVCGVRTHPDHRGRSPCGAVR